MTDSSEIGRYGTLRLLKRHEPETTVAFFPIDDETVTFGRSKQCSVRLYYDCVSELHCTLQFSEEHKAFLLVQGTNGLLVDGCQVNPVGSPGSGPTTVPLVNGSEIEIYKKRFKFEYPPKEIRAALLATPRPAKARRSLRMSMIRSAQVFTPRATADVPQTPQRSNIGRGMDWEALRTPVRVPSQDGTPEQETTLLEGEGDDAFVVEDEKDIIVLEKVDNHAQEELAWPIPPKPNRGRSVAFSIPTATPPPRPIPVPQSAQILQRAPQAMSANRRRSAPSLHRAVVLRSAQRALQREQERFEEELEEDEVEAEVSPERELGPREVGDEEDDGHNGSYDDQEDENDEISDEYPPIVSSNAPPARPARRKSAFQASLDAMRKVIPLPFNWKAPEEVPLPDDDDDRYDEDHEEEHEQDDEHQRPDDDDDDLEGEQGLVFQTPIRRNLGPFMTPQIQSNRPAQRIPVDVKARASVGGEGADQKIFGGAQRVRVVPAWKVTDIVIPEPEKLVSTAEKREVKKERVSEEERQAIMARRKSALNTPSSLPMPGPRSSALPPSTRTDAYTPGEDSDEDADTMLEKMTQKMIDVRRKSEARKMRMSVEGRQQGDEFSLFAPRSARKNQGFLGTGILEETLGQMKLSELDEQPQETTGSNFNTEDHGDILGTFSGEDRQPVARAAFGPEASSLTPRFDGVREMFRQPRVEPKTPSFAGFKAMFKERPATTAKTPSFRGVREMFNRTEAGTGLATPRMNLGEIFDEDESESEDMLADLGGDHQTPDEDVAATPQLDRFPTSRAKATRAVKSEEPVAPTPAPKTSTRTRKAAASGSKRPSRKKDVPPVDVPSAVLEEQSSDEEDEEVELAPTVRRVANRTTKNTATPTADDSMPPGKTSGRGASRSTRKTAGDLSDGTTKGIVVHKTSKTRRVAEDDSEDEEPPKPSGKTRNAGRGRGKRKGQEASETELEPEIPVKPKAVTRKAKETATSDSEEVVPPKPRRAAKTPQGREDPVEITSAPAATKPARRVKTEQSLPASVPPVPKSRRWGRSKGVEQVEEPLIQIDDHESESEDISPVQTKGRVSKKGVVKKTPVAKDIVSDDKENSAQEQPISSYKTTTTRTRRAAVAPVEALDAPAKRTRSRK